MKRALENPRLALTGTLCSAIVCGAGVIALQGPDGVLVAAILLTLALVVGGVGGAYATNRRLGWGLAVLAAATLPLFFGLYAVGLGILRTLGPGIAGALLLVLGIALTAVTLRIWLHLLRRRAKHP